MSIRQSPPAERPAPASRPVAFPQRAPATSTKMTAAQYKALKKPRNKYNNKITTIDGIKFRSKKEARRYAVLKRMQGIDMISGLRMQPRYVLVVNGVTVGLMVADFEYMEHGKDFLNSRYVVEDVKGAKTLLWKLKWALAKVLYPHIDWRIT